MPNDKNAPGKKEPVSLRSRLIESLRTRTTLRQAIVLAEILAPPLALRPTNLPRATGTRRPGT
jgi:hypothetical protein